MRQRDYLGDERLRDRIVYNKGDSVCIYCGGLADSREHIPSKTFLKKPFPDNLYTVPSCVKCNNSFSGDELYTRIVLDTLESAARENTLQSCKNGASLKYPRLAESIVSEIEAFRSNRSCETTTFHFRSKKIERVLEKLARGHAVYELSETYYLEGENAWDIAKTFYSFRPLLSEETIDNYDCAADIQNCILPEIGSRVYENVFPVQIPIAHIDGVGTYVLRSVLLDWTDIQDSTYRYIAVFAGNMIQVNIVIDEFLFATVFFVLHEDRNCINSFIEKLDESEYSLKDVPFAIANYPLERSHG